MQSYVIILRKKTTTTTVHTLPHSCPHVQSLCLLSHLHPYAHADKNQSERERERERERDGLNEGEGNLVSLVIFNYSTMFSRYPYQIYIYISV